MSWSIRLVTSVTIFLQFAGFSASAGDNLSQWGGNRFRGTVREVIQPISVNIIDPMTRATRLPSGRIFIADRYHARSYPARHQSLRHARPMTPYAPPAFYIIGEASRKNMGAPVKLNHGIKARRGLKTQPNVVFLVQKPGQKILSSR